MNKQAILRLYKFLDKDLPFYKPVRTSIEIDNWRTDGKGRTYDFRYAWYTSHKGFENESSVIQTLFKLPLEEFRQKVNQLKQNLQLAYEKELQQEKNMQENEEWLLNQSTKSS